MPPDHGTHRDFILPWAEAIERRSKTHVTVHDGEGKLGQLSEQYTQVSTGIVDAAHSPASLPAGRFPLSCLLSLPFLCPGSAQGTTILWSMFEEGLLPEFDQFKVLALHADSGGVLHTRDRPVTRLEDLAGLRLRTPAGPMAAALAALGAIPIALPPPEIHGAVRDGRVDGAIMAWDVVAYTRTAESLPFHTDTRLFVSPLYFIMNRAHYEALPGTLRDAVDAESGPALVRKFPGWWDSWEAPGRRLAEAPGQIIVRLEAGERDRWRNAAAPAIAAHLDTLTQSGLAGAHALYRRALELV